MPLLALGMIAGVSFVAQPAKFLTPDLSLPQLVSVGATLFDVSHALQWGWLVLLAVFVPRAKARRSAAWTLLTAIAITLALQQFGLMPALDAQLVALKHGLPAEPSLAHAAYIALETSKVAALVVLSVLRPAARPLPFELWRTAA